MFCVLNDSNLKCYPVEHIFISPSVRSRGAVRCTIYLPFQGIPDAEGRGAGEAAAAGGESQTRDGASQSPLPAAGHRDRGTIRYRALHAAAATAGGHRHSDPLQVMTL